MPVHPKTQAALDAAHAALDDVRHGARAISEEADQSPTIDALKKITASIADVPLPVAPEPSAAPKQGKAKKGAKSARRRVTQL